MILIPEDIMQKGDIVHFRNLGDAPVDYFVGHPASLFLSLNTVSFVERPDPTPDPDYREQVRILREALEKLLKCAALRDGSCGQCEGEARAALEATK